jgi:hypothetical protein
MLLQMQVIQRKDAIASFQNTKNAQPHWQRNSAKLRGVTCSASMVSSEATGQPLLQRQSNMGTWDSTGIITENALLCKH